MVNLRLLLQLALVQIPVVLVVDIGVDSLLRRTAAQNQLSGAPRGGKAQTNMLGTPVANEGGGLVSRERR